MLVYFNENNKMHILLQFMKWMLCAAVPNEMTMPSD